MKSLKQNKTNKQKQQFNATKIAKHVKQYSAGKIIGTFVQIM